MKVAFIRYKYDPHGGAERFTDTVIRSLAERGVEVHVFARQWTHEVAPSIVVHPVGGFDRPSLLRHASFATLVRRALRGFQFDLVQSNERTLCQDVYRAGDGVHSRWLELRSANSGWLKRATFRLNPFHLYLRHLERRLFQDPHLKAVIVNSRMVRDEILSRFRIGGEKVHVIPNGVDLDRFHPKHRSDTGVSLRDRHGISRSAPVVLFVGSGFERKGLEPLMRAVASVGGGLQLWVVGKGKTRRYEGLASRLGIASRTRFPGPQDDVAPFFAASDIFALPTVYDPFPSVILEAMASGLPVITTAQCGAAEIIAQGREGFVVDSASRVDQIAVYLAQLLEPRVRTRMGEAARKQAARFPMERTVRELEALYRRLLGAA